MSNPFEELTNRLDRIESLIRTAPPKNSEASETLTLIQASKLCQISTSRMYDLSRRKLIPSSRIGNRYIFIKDDLINWIRSHAK